MPKKFLGVDDATGVEIFRQGHLVARSSIGSTSSFALGMINPLTALKSGTMGKHAFALKALKFEHKVLKQSVCSQDQVAAAYGESNVIHFLPNDSVRLNPLILPTVRLEEFEKDLTSLYTDTSLTGGQIAISVIARMRGTTSELRQMCNLVDQATDILSGNGSVNSIGELLHQTRVLKRGLAEGVTSSAVDEIYEIARRRRALGGKLSGGAPMDSCCSSSRRQNRRFSCAR